jgi:rod shape-determining protein MreB
MARAFGADIGYHSVKLYLPEEDTPYISEPAVLALNGNDTVAACGSAALRLAKRVPGTVRIIHPFSGETTPDPEHAAAYFAYLVKGKKLRGYDLCFSLSGRHDEETETIFVEAAQRAGVRDVMAVESLYAAANGCNIPAVAESAVINIGASVTDMGCFCRAQQVASASCGYAGNLFVRAIVAYVLRKYRLSLTLVEAERIKCALGTMSPTGGRTLEAMALRPAMGLPKKIVLTEEEISACFENVFDHLVDEILALVRGLQLDPDKIILTGGGAKLAELASALSPLLCLPVVVAKEPELAVIRGVAVLMNQGKRK